MIGDFLRRILRPSNRMPPVPPEGQEQYRWRRHRHRQELDDFHQRLDALRYFAEGVEGPAADYRDRGQ